MAKLLTQIIYNQKFKGMKSELKRHSWINPCSAYRNLIKFLLSKTCLLKYVATYLELVKALYRLELEFINFTNRCFNPVFVFWYTQVGNVACKFYTVRECSLHNFPPKYFIKTLWKRSNLFCRYMFKKSKKILCLQKYRNPHTFSYMYNALGIYNFQ